MEGKGGREGSVRHWPALPLLPSGQMGELVGTLPLLLLLLVLCGLDRALYSIFDTIRHHAFWQYSFRSEPESCSGVPLHSPPTPVLPISWPPSVSGQISALPLTAASGNPSL